MNISQTQQAILHLLVQSETTLQDLLTGDNAIETSVNTVDTSHMNQTIKKTIIKTHHKKPDQPNQTDQHHQSVLEHAALLKERTLLENERQKVANMEMVIAVVGTTKAGKSTIINALVGQEILPNCELPTTAFPTLVTHKQGQTTPMLNFHHIQPLITLQQHVMAQLANIQADKQPTKQPLSLLHSPIGQRLLKQLQTHNVTPILTHYEGQAAIFTILQHLNDLVRIAESIDITIPYAAYQQLNQLPRIEVEFFHLRNNQHFQQARLSFLDTSGLNEQENNQHLHSLFQQQLAQASAILLAIDYTQMNSAADTLIRDNVGKIQSRLQQKLIVFVNKFDHAHTHTMSASRTKTYIAQQFIDQQLTDKGLPKKHIFPVSSWWGYLAHKALMVLETQHKLPNDEAWVQDFGEAALGRHWHEKITDMDEVKTASQTLWQDSKFSAPINDVITTMHTQSAFKCMNSSLDKLETRLSKLNTALNHRLTQLKNTITPNQETIEQLDKEIKQLREIKQQVDTKKSLLIHETNKRIANKNNKPIHHALKVSNVFIETGYKENQLIAEINQPKPSRNIYANIKKSENNNLCYKNRDDAIYLLNDMQCYINSIKRNLLEASNSILKENIEDIKHKIDHIFDDAFRKQLQQKLTHQITTSYGSFILPKFICEKHIESLQIKNLILIGIEEKTSTRKRDYVNNKVLNSVKGTWGKKTHTKDITRFEVNIQTIKKYIQDDMNKYTQSIQNHHKKYLNENIIQKVNRDADEVKKNLKHQQKQLKKTLKSLITETKNNKQMITLLEKANKNILSILHNTKQQRRNVHRTQQSQAQTKLTARREEEKALVTS